MVKRTPQRRDKETHMRKFVYSMHPLADNLTISCVWRPKQSSGNPCSPRPPRASIPRRAMSLPNAFPDLVLAILPPKCTHDHLSVLLLSRTDAHSSIYCISLDNLAHHENGIDKLSASGWIELTYSLIYVLTPLGTKKGEGAGERRIHRMVNCQVLRALAASVSFPMPTGQTISDMLGAAE